LLSATAELAAVASRHLASARAHRNSIPRSALPALLPAIIAERSLVRLKRAGYDPFDPALAMPDATQSWRLAIASLRARF
jgi:phytoene synthase